LTICQRGFARLPPTRLRKLEKEYKISDKLSEEEKKIIQEQEQKIHALDEQGYVSFFFDYIFPHLIDKLIFLKY